jgi:hypothetical protein
MQLPADLEALRHCLRLGLGVSPGGDAAPLPRPDWQQVVQHARLAGVLPLVYRGLQTGNLAAEVPKEVLDRCVQAHYATAQGNLITLDRLSRLLAGLRAQDIPALPLKGAHLAELVYPNPALRGIGDLDLLVRARHLPRILGVLAALGYGVSARDRLKARVPAVSHSLSGLTGPNFPRIDLHWGLVPLRMPLSVDTAGVWQRARPVLFCGAEIPVMPPEDLLAHVCVHYACSHLFERTWRPLCDVTMILLRHAENLDWARLAALADVWRAARCVGVVMALAEGLLGAPVPDGMVRQLGVQDADLKIARGIVADRLGLAGRSAGGTLRRVRATVRAYGPSLRSPWVCLSYVAGGAGALLRPWRLRKAVCEATRRRDIEVWLTAP